MLGSSQLAETTQSFYQRLCSQKSTRQQRRRRAKAVSVKSAFKLTQTAQTGASASNQTRKPRPCLCVGPRLCCSGEAATFVLSLLCDAWYRRSEQRNAGGICESHVRVSACVCVFACACACLRFVRPLPLWPQFEVNGPVCILLLPLCAQTSVPLILRTTICLHHECYYFLFLYIHHQTALFPPRLPLFLCPRSDLFLSVFAFSFFIL